MSDQRLTYLTREFVAYVGVGTAGFTMLSLLLLDSGLRAHWILGIGMAYGWFVNWIEGLAQARTEERLGESSSEGVSP